MSNLFQGWEKSHLAVVCQGYLINSSTQTDICETYYQLGHKEHNRIFPFNLLKRKYYSGIIDFDTAEIEKIIPIKSKLRVALLKSYITPFLRWIGITNFVSKIQLSEDLKNWMTAYQPDILYAQAQGREGILFCLEVQQFLNKPMVFHMMDDWPELEKERGLLGKYWGNRIDHEFQKLMSKSAFHLSISELMSLEYERRYGKEFIAFHNPIDLDFWKRYQRSNYNLSDTPTILYAGRVGLGIEDSLKVMVKAVGIINKQLNISLKFILQVSEKPNWVDRYPWVEHRGFVNYEDLPRMFSEADFLYLPYDFSPSSVKFIKYSMPTKASEFMISGTPVLIFSPDETAIVSYAKKYNWAKVINENTVDALVEGMKSLILDKSERKRIARAAIKLAEENHSAEVVRREFRETLRGVSNGTSQAE